MQILKVLGKYLLPGVLAISFIGVYAVNNSAFDLLLMALFGLIGYLLRRLEFPLVPYHPWAGFRGHYGKNLVRLMTISGGDWKALFFDVRTAKFNVITFMLYLAALFSLFAPQLLGLKRFRAVAVEADTEL